MSDDFDSLFDAAPVVPAPAVDQVASAIAVPAPSPAAAPEEAAAVTVWLALYKPGSAVQYEGERHTVNHVHISRNGLYVRLKDKEGIVPAEKVDVPLTRVALPPGAYLPPPSLQPPLLPPGPARTK